MSDTPPDFIPYKRFKEEVDKNARLTTQIGTLETQLGTRDEADTTTLRGITDERDALIAELGRTRGQYEMEKVLPPGLTKEGLEYLTWKHDSVKVEEGKEKPSFTDWFKEYGAANAATVDSFVTKDEKPPEPKVEPKAPPPEPEQRRYPWQKVPDSHASEPGNRDTHKPPPKAPTDAHAFSQLTQEKRVEQLQDMGWMDKPKAAEV